MPTLIIGCRHAASSSTSPSSPLRPKHSSQLERQRVAVEKRFAGPADESGVLELLDAGQVAKALETEVGEERRRGDIRIGRAGRQAARPDEAFAAQRCPQRGPDRVANA
jgi:hypothetical protein